MTVEEILQLTADAARAILAAARATVAILAPDPRLRAARPRPRRRELGPAATRTRAPVGASSPARGNELGMLEVVDRAGREFTARDEAILTQLAQLASVAIANAQLYDRERTIAHTLQRSLRPGRAADRARPVGRRALPPRRRGRSSSAATSTTSSARATAAGRR